MTRSETFTTRLSKETALWVEHEARRTRRSKSAILASLAEEAARTRRFPGIAFRGSEIEGRRAWIPGAGFDVWQIIEGYQAKGSLARLLEESDLTERQVRLALTYYEHYPEEIDDAIRANQISQEELHILYPTIIPPVASGQ